MTGFKQAVFAVFIFVFSQALKAEGIQAEHEIQIEGVTRNYLVFTPQQKMVKSPLMIVLHGGTGNSRHALRTMGMNEVALKNQFLVAYPNGTSTLMGKDRRVWNAGKCCAIAQRKNIDDVRFISEMVKQILEKYSVDSHRIYITGESNGAMLAYRLVCELPDVFAAAVPVSGTLMINQCNGGQNVALLDIHGDADKNVPYNGGKGEGLANAKFRSVPESLKIITALRNCQEPVKKTLSNGDLETQYTCKEGAPVRARLIKGGGHAWPASSGPEKNSSFSAAVEAWNFAKNYSR